MEKNNKAHPTVFMIFGGAGDLAWRKLVPALYDISVDRKGGEYSIIAIDRVQMSDEELRNHLKEGVNQFSRTGEVKPADWDLFAKKIHYQQGDFMKMETYSALKEICVKSEKEWGPETRMVFYMATPPALFGEIPEWLAKAGLSQDRERMRFVVEKPIGYDLKTATDLNHVFTKYFDESQIFRIDHYLGKETVQNILAFRFANPLFEPIWNSRFVDYVTITVAESIGIENRGDYYDKSGAIRDMVQNHLMQLLCLVAMEPMVSFHADEIRNKKVDVLHAIRPIPPEHVDSFAVRGQYAGGKIEGKEVQGYRDEKGVNPRSGTETFAALKFFVDNWRWQDVPFYIRTGKRLPMRSSEIVIQFLKVPHQAFPKEAATDWQPARITLSIQPYEGIVLRFQAKQPGPEVFLKPVDMKFNYRESFSGPFPGAYETLLWDVIQNDPTEFMRADQVEAAWQILEPVLEHWQAHEPTDFPNYPAGSWGPEACERLVAGQNHTWLAPTLLT
ncbi:MAG: glucose-6-phosphate dehydrogenase [Bacteroidales bacterium]